MLPREEAIAQCKEKCQPGYKRPKEYVTESARAGSYYSSSQVTAVLDFWLVEFVCTSVVKGVLNTFWRI